MKIKTNKARCKSCDTVIESTHRYDFVACPCFENSENTLGIFIDGGKEYLRRGGYLDSIEELSEYE